MKLDNAIAATLIEWAQLVTATAAGVAENTAGPAASGQDGYPFEYVVGWSNIISAIVAIASLLIAAAGIFFVWVQLRQIKYQGLKDEKANHAALMLDLAKRWSEVLEARYKVMQKLRSPDAFNVDIAKDFHNDCSRLMDSDFWKDELRKVLNFYEFLGLMIHQGNIDANEAFVLVSVDHFNWDSLREEHGKEREDTTFKDGDFYQKVAPYLDLVREYRTDIYVYYDYYLTELYHANRLQPFLPEHPVNSSLEMRYNAETRRYGWV